MIIANSVVAELLPVGKRGKNKQKNSLVTKASTDTRFPSNICPDPRQNKNMLISEE